MVNSVDTRLSAAETAGVLAAFDEWNAALATGDPWAVIAKYTRDGMLIPTLSEDVCTCPSDLHAYFVVFLAKLPQGTLNEYNIRLEAVDRLGEPLVVSNSGIYTFEFGEEGAKPATARFTFLYKRVGTEWRIHQHHSSLMPEL